MGESSTGMHSLLTKLRRRQGQGYLEGLLVTWMMVIMMAGIYALGSQIWARTFVHTTTALAAQQALVAYDRHAFNASVGDTDSEQRGREAATEAANVVLNSVTEPAAGAFTVLRIEDTGCGGAGAGPGPWSPSVSVTPNAGFVTVRVATNTSWKLGGFYQSCLPVERSITGDKR